MPATFTWQDKVAQPLAWPILGISMPAFLLNALCLWAGTCNLLCTLSQISLTSSYDWTLGHTLCYTSMDVNKNVLFGDS